MQQPTVFIVAIEGRIQKVFQSFDDAKTYVSDHTALYPPRGETACSVYTTDEWAVTLPKEK